MVGAWQLQMWGTQQAARPFSQSLPGSLPGQMQILGHCRKLLVGRTVSWTTPLYHWPLKLHIVERDMGWVSFTPFEAFGRLVGTVESGALTWSRADSLLIMGISQCHLGPQSKVSKVVRLRA